MHLAPRVLLLLLLLLLCTWYYCCSNWYYYCSNNSIDMILIVIVADVHQVFVSIPMYHLSPASRTIEPQRAARRTWEGAAGWQASHGWGSCTSWASGGGACSTLRIAFLFLLFLFSMQWEIDGEEKMIKPSKIVLRTFFPIHLFVCFFFFSFFDHDYLWSFDHDYLWSFDVPSSSRPSRRLCSRCDADIRSAPFNFEPNIHENNRMPLSLFGDAFVLFSCHFISCSASITYTEGPYRYYIAGTDQMRYGWIHHTILTQSPETVVIIEERLICTCWHVLPMLFAM